MTPSEGDEVERGLVLGPTIQALPKDVESRVLSQTPAGENKSEEFDTIGVSESIGIVPLVEPAIVHESAASEEIEPGEHPVATCRPSQESTSESFVISSVTF